ncbi:hypothetical protein CRG98_018786 [Punica granatum]|uniref:Uncharacterized protein n=1 Tax=Punica granatum TaxID=22663 RepID=A0A2I0JWW0_PUNGR|nr:hypothetical protein CRG98_018786 [Punica granatum]
MVAVLAGKGVLEDVRPTSCDGSERFSWVGGLYRGTVLPKDRGPRFKGMNSLKPSGILFKAETAIELHVVPPTSNPYLTCGS